MKLNFNIVIAALLISVAAMSGCIKNDDPVEPCTPKTAESELPVMTKFAADSSISTTLDASGLMYQIIDAGTGAAPSANSNITFKYRVHSMSGSKLEENMSGISYPLNNLIPAWQIALPKIKAGRKIKIISPSKLAYGCNPNHPLANQPLYFYIELVSVQ